MMKEQPPTQGEPKWQRAIWIGGGAFVGIILGAILANLIGADGGAVPWPGIGAGLGAAVGMILLNRRVGR
ncbi:MAG: hypothetical protein OT477_05630 [Chloroflexi bacterium]|nr:hypothetical protein [Chloroflexota bacterium]